MSALTEKVAREHVRLVRPLGTCDGCSCTDEDVPSYADHVIEVTEAATRAQVAADIRAEADQGDYGNPALLEAAARIAEGKQP